MASVLLLNKTGPCVMFLNMIMCHLSPGKLEAIIYKNKVYYF